METPAKHTCLKLEIPSGGGSKFDPVFVKGTWYPTRFDISITDGLQAWSCHATEDEVKERASSWDQTVSDYVDLAERYLGFQQPGSTYGFSDAGNGSKRLTWTFEKEGTKLEWRWKCQPSHDSKKTTAEVLDFLMDANIRLSEEVMWKTQSFDSLKQEAEKCLAQSEKLSKEKVELESELFEKFVNVLNTKKAKLRELRDRLSKQATTSHQSPEHKDEEESTDRTSSFGEEESDKNNELEKKSISSDDDGLTSSRNRRKRKF